MKTTHTTIGEATPGETLTVDNQIQTYTVKIRSCHGVGEGQLKDLIETKWEVVAIKEEERHLVSVAPKNRDTFPE